MHLNPELPIGSFPEASAYGNPFLYYEREILHISAFGVDPGQVGEVR